MKTVRTSEATVLSLLKSSRVRRRDFPRRELLESARHLLGSGRHAALLWLIDRERGDLVLNVCSADPGNHRDYEGLVGLTVRPRRQFKEPSSDPNDWLLRLNEQPRVKAWASEHSMGTCESSFPVEIVRDGEPHVIAFVQLLSESPPTESTIVAITSICDALAVALQRSRDARKLEAIQKIPKEWSEDLDLEHWLSSIAEMICTTIDAQACLVFRDARGGGFKSVATYPKGEIFNASDRSAIKVVAREWKKRREVRLRDWDDHEERRRAFGTAEHDNTLHAAVSFRLLGDKKRPVRIRSVMMTPIIFEGQALAVMVIINKRPEVHLAGFFSETDMQVLTLASEYIAGVLPTREMYRALQRLSEIVSPRALDEEEEREKIFEVLSEVVPGITGAALVRKRRGSLASQVDQLGGEMSTLEEARLTEQKDTVYGLPQAQLPAGTRKYAYTKTITDANLANRAYLAIELTKSTLGQYERHVLSFVCREVAHLLLSEQGLDDVNAEFMQLRHAVRSGLTGAVGYVHEALSEYERYKRNDFAVTDLARGRFHKALRRANSAAAKTQHLFDSRILLGSISPASLKLAEYSINAIVSSVVDTLLPYAEIRRVQLNFDLKMPPGLATVKCDMDLIDMLIFNVVDNGVKYSRPKENVYVSLTPVKSEWQLEVTNYGDLIPKEDIEMIFEPFVRHPAQISRHAGTGLGLAVARDVARVHGGTIDCRSDVWQEHGAETVFTVRIPRNPTRS